MEIATNAVLLAVLVDFSAAVKSLELPLPTPLDQSNVVRFRVTGGYIDTESYLSSYLVYRGGYEFWHDWGCVEGFSTSDAYTRLQEVSQLRRLCGTVRHSEQQCLQKARVAIRSLGFTNLAALRVPPKVRTRPTQLREGILPRYVFEWRVDDDPPITCEVNAERLTVEYLIVLGPKAGRKPWPITFGQTNVVEPPEPKKPARTEMAVRGMSREYAFAFLRAILPGASHFCAKLGLPLPDPITEAEVNLPESEVAMHFGRPLVSLRLKCGYLVTYYAGHVGGVEAEDAYRTQPGFRKNVRGSEEFRGPIRVSQREAVERVRTLLLERLGLPAQPLFLDAEPVHQYAANPKATEGVRRYVFRWQRPETAEAQAAREARQEAPDISIAAEVDAVSGALKGLFLYHKFFERPDPVLDVPMNDNVKSPPK